MILLYVGAFASHSEREMRRQNEQWQCHFLENMEYLDNGRPHLRNAGISWPRIASVTLPAPI